MSAFDKIIGYESIKAEMKILCDILKNPDKYKALGTKTHSGIMFYGDPGIGKSLMANAIIEECGLPSFVIRKDKPDGEFVNYIREIFEKAMDTSPCIILLDDMDKFANADEQHPNCEEFVTVQACIDMVKGKGVFVLATVNDRDLLPDSLTRMGRFDKLIEMRNPEGREAELIVEHFLSQKKISADVDSKEIARILDGRSCAELETITNEAGIYATFEGRDTISHNDFIRACLRYIFDAPETLEPGEHEDNRHVAIHEAGHAVISEILNPGSVNLISVAGYRGSTRGITSITKPADYWHSLELMEHHVTGLLGGKAATEILTGRVDVGTGSDISRAYRIIHRIIDDYCANDFTAYTTNPVGSWVRESKDRQISFEMTRLYQKARRILIENETFLKALIDELLKKETLTGKDIREIKSRIYDQAA